VQAQDAVCPVAVFEVSLVLGITGNGRRGVLGPPIADNEGARFWQVKMRSGGRPYRTRIFGAWGQAPKDASCDFPACGARGG